MNQEARTPSIKQQIYTSLHKDIINGVYPVNSVLNEKTLVNKYNVSKTPVREALVQLCSEGLLNNIPRFGYQVMSISPSEIVEIIEFRKVIEIAALESVFPQLTPEHIMKLKKLNDQAAQILGSRNVKTQWNYNRIFHSELCAFSKNRYFIKALDDALNICTRISNQYFTRIWSELRVPNTMTHEMLVTALEKGLLEEAKSILIDDLESLRYEIL